MYMAAEMDSGNNWHFDNYAYTRATSAEHKKIVWTYIVYQIFPMVLTCIHRKFIQACLVRVSGGALWLAQDPTVVIADSQADLSIRWA